MPGSRRTIPPAFSLPLVILVLLSIAPGCDGDPEVPRSKILLIGLDGAEWDLITPMVEAGDLPNFARIMEGGVYGKLRSLEPLAKSPAIWTTIATGRSPEEHGIRTFVNSDGGKPLTTNLRKVRALWNILSGLDRTVGVVGWLMSWPAEEVNGFVVTDYLQYGPGKGGRFAHRTYPAELEDTVAPMATPWEDLPWDFVMRFLSAPLDTAAMSENLMRELRPIRMHTAADHSFARIGENLYREERPDFFAVYLRGMDTMGHIYWNYMQPESVPASDLEPEAIPYLEGVMHGYYKYIDELIGPFLDLADDETSVIIVSDHGFQGGPKGGVAAHKIDGVVMMTGKNVGKGEITGATVYDIAPTILVLMGLPPSEEMRGKVLWSALGETIPRDRFAQLIPTYETGELGGGAPVQSPVDEEIKERLRSLGYID